MIHPISLAILVSVAGVVLIRRYRFTQRSTPERIDDPHLRELRMLLERMDDRWRSLGLRRGDGETLHQFAKRLESAEWAESVALAKASKNIRETETATAADWYRRFAAIRFGGRLDQESVELLRPGVSPKLSSGTEVPSAHNDSRS